MNSRALAFGLVWQADLALEIFTAVVDHTTTPDIVVKRVAALSRRIPTFEVNGGVVCDDGFRLAWKDEVVFDMFDGNRIDYVPGPDWRGALPISFYSTVAALTVAWRGHVPIHGSAVEIEGRAVLVCGTGGAGKSTVTAGLIEQGAHFISDDLSVVAWSQAHGRHVVFPGRPTLRLYPATAGWLNHTEILPFNNDPRGKLLVRPLRRTSLSEIPLTGLLWIGPRGDPVAKAESYEVLKAQVFRPRWMAKLIKPEMLKRSLLDIARAIHMTRMMSVDLREREVFQSRTREALTLIRSML
jgi:hypothetical protein